MKKTRWVKCADELEVVEVVGKIKRDTTASFHPQQRSHQSPQCHRSAQVHYMMLLTKTLDPQPRFAAKQIVKTK
jgi:hypothetical protein